MTPVIDRLIDDFEARRLSRRDLVTALIALAAAPVARAAPVQPVVKADTLNHVSLAVADVERSARFYQELLGLEVVSRPGNGGVNLGLGSGFLGIYALPQPGQVHHFCLGVEDYDADRLSARLGEAGVRTVVDRDPANRTSGGDQVYLPDPDGIIVQLGPNGYQG